jgi:hypothetical protein
MRENALWYLKTDPDALEQRFQNIIATKSHKLTRGGFRTGILEKLLIIATKPSHIRTVMQALTIMQNRDQKFSVPQSTTSILCKAAARIGAPEIGLSFIQMPWLKMWPTKYAVESLVKRYVVDAETHFIDRLVIGEKTTVPVSSARVEDDAALDEESKAKKNRKRIDMWLNDFINVYRELVSDRHPNWRADSLSHSLGIRFYASVGDTDTAKQICNTTPDVTPRAIRDLMLALIAQGKEKEALEYVSKTNSNNSEHLQQAIIATYLALGDKDSLKEFLKTIDQISILHCKSHFGDEARKNILKEVLQESLDKQPEAVVNYLQQ